MLRHNPVGGPTTGVNTFGDGGVANYTKIAADGEVTLYGTARVTKWIELSGAMFSIGSTPPAAIVFGNYAAWGFTIGDDSLLSVEIPQDWAAGTDLTLAIDWGINRAYADENGEVQWNIAWTATPHDGSQALDAASATLDPGDTNIPAIAKSLIHTHIGVIPGGSLAVGDEIGLKIMRVAIDDGVDPGGAQEPHIIHLNVEYTSDKHGAAT